METALEHRTYFLLEYIQRRTGVATGVYRLYLYTPKISPGKFCALIAADNVRQVASTYRTIVLYSKIYTPKTNFWLCP